MVIGGMALALELRRLWPGIILNETHPKVLFRERMCRAYSAASPHFEADVSDFCRVHGLTVPAGLSEHAFDAVLSAWATQQGLECNWSDLVQETRGEERLLFPVEPPVRYLWPTKSGATYTE